MFHRRDSHIIEMQLSEWSQQPDDVCNSSTFNSHSTPYTTFISKFNYQSFINTRRHFRRFFSPRLRSDLDRRGERKFSFLSLSLSWERDRWFLKWEQVELNQISPSFSPSRFVLTSRSNDGRYPPNWQIERNINRDFETRFLTVTVSPVSLSSKIKTPAVRIKSDISLSKVAGEKK